MHTIQSSRFKDAPWYPGDNQQHCVVGGAGGIGSWLSLMLARAGFIPIIYDFDHIEEHNIGGQLFSKKDVSSAKVTALSRIIKEFSNVDIMANFEKYDSSTMSHNYVFSAFDNMQARKDMFNNWKEFVKDWKKEVDSFKPSTSYSLTLIDSGESKLAVVKLVKELTGLDLKEAKEKIDTPPSLLIDKAKSKEDLDLLKVALEDAGAKVQVDEVTTKVDVTNTPIFIDGRLLMEQLTIFCVTPDNMDKYEEHLFDDSEVPPEPCTLKQTSHSAAMIASHMVGFFTNHFANNVTQEDDRTVPFQWEYFIPIDYINQL